MNYDMFKRHLKSADIGVSEFAALMQMPHRQTISNYSNVGFVPDHLAVIAALIDKIAEAGMDYRAVIAQIEFKRKKSRGKTFSKTPPTEGCAA